MIKERPGLKPGQVMRRVLRDKKFGGFCRQGQSIERTFRIPEQDPETANPRNRPASKLALHAAITDRT